MKDWAIDYSQYKAWNECHAMWYERYVARTRPKPKEGQQDNALTLGSLVHEGLRSLRQSGKVEISAEAISLYNPTPDCVAWARALTHGYARHYPVEEFALSVCEAPVKFPLPGGLEGLAKVDYYFRVNEPTQLATGLGDYFTLTPGVWIKEYKTKDASRNIGNYYLQWKVNMQVDFQCLALRAHLQEPVQGVLIDVLEKPKLYQPKRKCPSCNTTYEFTEWVPTGEGYACPGCGSVKDLQPVKQTTIPEPSYYRIAQARSRERLEHSLAYIRDVADEMSYFLQEGYHPKMWELAPATESKCVDGIFGPCVYFASHSEQAFAVGQQGFIQIEDPWDYLKR